MNADTAHFVEHCVSKLVPFHPRHYTSWEVVCVCVCAILLGCGGGGDGGTVGGGGGVDSGSVEFCCHPWRVGQVWQIPEHMGVANNVELRGVSFNCPTTGPSPIFLPLFFASQWAIVKIFPTTLRLLFVCILLLFFCLCNAVCVDDFIIIFYAFINLLISSYFYIWSLMCQSLCKALRPTFVVFESAL